MQAVWFLTEYSMQNGVLIETTIEDFPLYTNCLFPPAVDGTFLKCLVAKTVSPEKGAKVKKVFLIISFW